MGTYYYVLMALYTLMKTRLWERRSGVRLTIRARNLSLLQIVRTDCGAQRTTYLIGTEVLPGLKSECDTITLFHLLPKIKIYFSIPPPPVCLQNVHTNNLCFTFYQVLLEEMWTGERSRYSDWLGPGRSEDRILMGTRFSAPVQTGRPPSLL